MIDDYYVTRNNVFYNIDRKKSILNGFPTCWTKLLVQPKWSVTITPSKSIEHFFNNIYKKI